MQADVETVKRAVLLDHDNLSSEDIQVSTGLDAKRVAVALKTLIASGKVTRTGVLRGTRYSFARERFE